MNLMFPLVHPLKLWYSTHMNIKLNISDSRIQPEDFLVLTEIIKGSKIKYEVDEESGLLALDRILSTSLRYPVNYGFIPNTLSEDGDPLDAFILCDEELLPMTLVRCAPIGVIEMIDNGERDEKIIAIPLHKNSPHKHLKDINDIPTHITREIMHFLRVYKDLEKENVVEVKDLLPKKQALKIIAEAKQRFAAQ